MLFEEKNRFSNYFNYFFIMNRVDAILKIVHADLIIV